MAAQGHLLHPVACSFPTPGADALGLVRVVVEDEHRTVTIDVPNAGQLVLHLHELRRAIAPPSFRPEFS